MEHAELQSFTQSVFLPCRLVVIALGDPIVKPAKSCHPGDLSLMNAEGEVLTADSRHLSGQDLKVSVWFQTPITGIAGIPPWKTGLQW